MANENGARYDDRSRVLSVISRTDFEMGLSRQMSNEFVKVEDHQKQMTDIEGALAAKKRRSFIAGAIFGTLIFVAIIMAGVSLQKTGNTAAKDTNNMDKHMRLYTISRLQEQINELEKKLNEKIDQKISKSDFMRRPWPQYGGTWGRGGAEETGKGGTRTFGLQN